MAIVTELKRQKRNPSRINIYLDGEYFIAADEVAVFKAGVKKGNEVDEKILADMLAADDEQRAFDTALKYLSYRLRSKKEVRDHLTEKGFDEGVIDGTIDKLAHYGYLDDLAFARLYYQSKKATVGMKKIIYMLRQFGVADEIIDLLDLTDDQSAIAKLAQKYRNSHITADDKKLAAYLASKGFEWDAIKSVLKENDYE